MVEVKAYNLPPTPLIPNNPNPLLHYPQLLQNKSAPEIHDLFASNAWKTQWIFRYGSTQRAHYHSKAHECMVVLTGSARIRFGVADTASDLEANTHGSEFEAGGVEVTAEAGDVFVLPAGVAHKTYDTRPEAEFELLTPGGGHGFGDRDPREVLGEVKLEGFTMIGAYPVNGGEWDFVTGEEEVEVEGLFEDVWKVVQPEHDPVLGDSREGLCGLWR